MCTLRVVPIACALLCLAAVLWGCESISHSFMDCGCLSSNDGCPKPDIKVADITTADGTEGPAPQVGQPCTVYDDCELGLCLSNEYLKGMGLENDQINIEGGMCSMMGCKDDSECGPDGACFDTTPFTGIAITICLLGCETLADCRWDEGYLCYNAPRDPDDEAAGEINACLSDSLVVAIECDDGHCEGLEPGDGHCDELVDCRWQDGFMCYWTDPAAAEGICIPDQTVVALECEDADCPALPVTPAEEE